MEEPRIKDIPKFRKSIDDLNNLKVFRKMRWLWKPIFSLLGVDIDTVDEALLNFDEIEAQLNELANIPDRFNECFSLRGWIIYELMNVDVAKAAIAKAESGDADGAEMDLVAYYNPEQIEFGLLSMHAINAFRPRMRLAQLAAIDYREERYHACIPVILALLDGMVNDLHENRRGFFAKDVDLQAWDSVAAHNKGLNVLVGIFQKGRNKTNSESISVPYRNGILHGMDLGFDNNMVAAKTWAALFATREWALKAERGLLTEPPKKPDTTWGNLIEQIRSNEAEKARLTAWKPRNIPIGDSFPSNGHPASYSDGTPEHKLAEFFLFWKARNYGYMALCLPALLGNSDRVLPKRIKESYSSKTLIDFDFINLDEKAPAITEIECNVKYEENNQRIERVILFRLINEDKDGIPGAPGKPGTSWVIYNWLL